ncbi:MAG: hypothetical protein JWQ83_1779 [Lacunisphaera sp.]|nr:hypothetical protein [Lacunisphaera sp.]
MTNLVMARFNYRAEYKERGGRTFYPVLLSDIQPIEIADLSGAEAPAAYHIVSGVPFQDAFEVRLHRGQLWWPLRGNHGGLRSLEFSDLAKNDWARASAVLDPLGRTYAHFGQTFDEAFPDGVKTFDPGDRDLQARQVREDAARLAFLDGVVHVQAGEPVWYAVLNRETRWGFELVIGPTSLDRKDREGCHMDCADRGTRLTSARLGRAFGLNELEEGLRWLAPDAVHTVSDVISMGIHDPSPAAEICAVAWAQYLWEVAWRFPDLRRLIPAVANAKNNRPPPADLPYLDMLETFVTSEGTEAVRGLPPTFAKAHLLLERLARSKHVHDLDFEEAIALLDR